MFAELMDRARLDPDRPFSVIVQNDRERPLTHGDVVALAAGFGEALNDAGIERGSTVLIVLPHGGSLYPAFIGTLLYGSVPSFMAPLTRKQDPDVFRASFAALVERIEPAAIVTTRAMKANIPAGARLVFAEDVAPASPDAVDEQADRAARLDERAVAFLQHSSGTTGLKKGVLLTHSAVRDQCRRYADAIGIRPGDTIVSWLPVYHDMGLIACFLLPAIIGCPVISLDALEWVMRPTSLLRRIETHRAAFAWLPNFAFQHIARMDTGKQAWDLASLRGLINCSEPCRATTFETFLARYRAAGLREDALHVTYALAENVFAVTHTAPGRPPRPGTRERSRGFISCGAPLDGTSVEIRSDDGGTLPEGEAGEIWFRSPSLFEGYFRQPDLTERKLKNGWYRTGDIGLLEEGELFVIGRIDDLVIVNGKNIMAHEVEEELGRIPELLPGRALVHGAFDDHRGTSELVVLAEHSDAARSLSDLESQIRNVVFSASGVYPMHIGLLKPGFLLKSTSGKLARAASIAKYERRDTR